MHQGFFQQFDITIFSEVAHCLDVVQIIRSLKNIHKCLKSKGKLVIVEQYPSFRLDQRLFDMTAGGSCFNAQEMLAVVEKTGLFNVIVKQFDDSSHYSIILEKV